MVYNISKFVLIMHYFPFISIYSVEPTVYYDFFYIHVPRIIGSFHII